MNVRDILKVKGNSIYTVSPEMFVQQAVFVLCEKKIGALPVTDDNGTLLGIISERDIICACNRNIDLKSTRISEVMTKDLVISLGDDDLDATMNVMTVKKIRHLPIVDNGKILGIISIGDVVNALRSEKETEVRYLTDYIKGVSKG